MIFIKLNQKVQAVSTRKAPVLTYQEQWLASFDAAVTGNTVRIDVMEEFVNSNHGRIREIKSKKFKIVVNPKRTHRLNQLFEEH